MESDRKLSRLERLLPAALIIAVMSFVAALSFRSVFDNWIFVVAPLLGVIGATGIGLFGMWKRLLLGETVAFSLLGYLGVGVIAVGGLPVPGSLVALLNGATNGWLRMLDSLPPADSAGDLKALPFTAAWLAAAIGIELLHRSKRVGMPALGPLLGLAISILFSVEQRPMVLFQGVLLAVLFLALVTVQFHAKRQVVGETRKVRPLRIAIGVATLAGVVLAAPIVAGFIIPDPPAGRIELRQLRPSPWEPLAAPSPMTSVKGFLAEERKEAIAFTITGPAVDRVAIAAMEVYDGRVWTVADGSPDAPAEFIPAGPALPADSLTDEVSEHTIEIRELGSFWMPVVGSPSRITFHDEQDDDQPAIQMNALTGTVALPSGLKDGVTYTVESFARPNPSDEELAAAALVVDIDRFALDLLPPSLQNAAADIVEGIDPGWGQVQALGEYLRDGFYAETDVAPGHSYARIAGFLASPTPQPIGYTEQYGAGGTVLARAVNLPSRVVLGFAVPEDRFVDGTAEVRFEDVNAWMEVLTDEYGWVAVDVTPDRSQEPEIKAAGKRTKIVASPNPPPPPPTTTTSTTIPLGADEEVEDQIVEEDEDDDDQEPAGFSGLPIVVKAGVLATGVPLILMLLFGGVMIAVKTGKRSKRRKNPDPAMSVAGAWYETLDRFREAGHTIEAWATPAEVARGFSAVSGSPLAVDTLDELAVQVDRAAFHSESPTGERAEFAWEMSDAAVALVQEDTSTFERIKMAVDPRTVFRPSRRGDPMGTETKSRSSKWSRNVE